ncbi:MAG: TolC family protein [Candidatus Zixiibacteriota bacterium]
MLEAARNFFQNLPSRLIVIVTLIAVTLPYAGISRELTIDEAVDMALNHSPRGSIIKGRLEVADQTYQAKKINFYLPEISINGSLPAYSEDETYRFFGGATEKSLYKTRDLNLQSFIQLKQSLITGGDLVMSANLAANDEKYPNTATGQFVYEDNQQGYFDFSYKQPLLKPSDSKYDLNNRRDDLEIARYTKIEEEYALKKEVTEAYLGLLRAQLTLKIATDNAAMAKLQADIDSAKYADGVIPEEDFLESASARLDAELEKYEAVTGVNESTRNLAILLDLDPSDSIQVVQPEITDHPDQQAIKQMENSWEQTVAIKKAEYQYEKSQRAANYAASSHGLNGDLALSYSFGRGRINREIEEQTTKDDINTNSWGVSLNFTYPIWDGGASGAAVKAAQFEADQAELEYKKARQSARAEIITLVGRIDVSYRRMEIVRKQIELADGKLKIAESRLKDGQISELTYLENKIFYLQTQDSYLEELTNYMTNRIDLESKFI